jgi:hypothetical protein
MTVHELLSRVSSQELTAWIAYFQEEPFGYDIENWRTAMLALGMASPNQKKGARKLRIKDFLPKSREQLEAEDQRGWSGDPL